jgi:uncharacterized protein (TIGR03435 family)
MKRLMLSVVALAAVSGSASFAQDLTGTWQGTLQAGKDLRTVVKISKADNGGWKVVFYSIDQTPQGFTADAATLDGSSLRFSITAIGGSYEGKLNAEGATFVGTWTQGPKPQPLTLTRANADAAWEIPKPMAPMDPNASPELEVATIKPSNPDVPGRWLTVRGHQFVTHALSLDAIIEFAYGVHLRQIVGGPDWLDKDRFDITGEPDHEGIPNDLQARTMIQKLMADRFKLSFHLDKKELSVYALSAGKNGPKIFRSENGGPLPDLSYGPTSGGILMRVSNATMADFSHSIQATVLDRPVVDHTGLPGRFDFRLTWAPDESQFGGHFPGGRSDDQTSTENPLPSLFTAIQEQIGLKLEPTKAPVEVMVIDHVEKPSAN